MLLSLGKMTWVRKQECDATPLIIALFALFV